MNHILTKFLIKFFIISFIFPANLQLWLNQIDSTIQESSIIKLSMKLEEIQVDDIDNNIIDNDFYLISDLSKDIYQFKYLDNIIYYDKEMVLQYNQISNQMFKYLPDKKIEKYLDKKILKHFFNFNNYKSDSSVEGYQYVYKSSILKLKNNIYINYLKDSVDILFIDGIYEMLFGNIEIIGLDSILFQNQLLIHRYQKDQDLEVFDFTQ
tara:strand:- start:429 stop:1055 length:627 start_codon:yes stop_codon:yes gene_type:complete